MWTSGKKTKPSITYSIIKSDPLKILDEVQYQSKGKIKTITGFDTIYNGQFIWRGKGILKLFTSKWEVIYVDSEILIIAFSSTLVTSSGMDILLRDKQNTESYKRQLKARPEVFNIDDQSLRNIEWLF